MAARDIVVIGASAGGFEAIRKLVAGLPRDLPAAIFVTIHITGNSDNILPHFIAKSTPLPAAHPVDGETIQNGRIYVAPPDTHLLIRPGFLQLGHGPRENLQRPSINTMFRSAGQSYGERVAGILLTGLLDDGVAGLWEIQQANGATIVQDPDEAEYPSMPQSAISGLKVQYIVRLEEMGHLLTRLASNGGPHSDPLSTAQVRLPENSAQACPECGGAMTATRMSHLLEFSCHTGHHFGLHTMIEQKTRNLEKMLETALAQSEELAELLRMAIDQPGGLDVVSLQDDLARCEDQQRLLRTLSDRAARPSAAESTPTPRHSHP